MAEPVLSEEPPSEPTEDPEQVVAIAFPALFISANTAAAATITVGIALTADALITSCKVVGAVYQ
jgi:hypothetical protein